MLHEYVCHARIDRNARDKLGKMIRDHLQKRLCQLSERTSLFAPFLACHAVDRLECRQRDTLFGIFVDRPVLGSPR
jgi:hypothetical protein